ncbi:hypothetical protein ACIQUZ_17435 [Streptomyces griseus]|uniref:hypothetical protein n=1 Tax=Streptomyces griseus TaxID=1911 RepID=UPI003826F2AC
MERFETESLALMPGQRVGATVLAHHPWGVTVALDGYENARLSASIDMIVQFSSSTRTHDELLALFPPVGSRVDAVIEWITRWHAPVSVRLSLRPDDLEALVGRCDFCGEPLTLGPGGEALVLDSRSHDGPGSHTVVCHRRCLAERISPENGGERARALTIGKTP